ncbi:phage-related conserved hypothetical protein [Halobacteriovorax marinus SJ]|uniref:Helix-turn-helix domain-containing protein n=1 Tax=Halobacteriovorax marinus (strain ATCC BAA-682 / DSM 15412 / SJ) TaxID=862908 RepID=E1X5W0_HALMS|nr:helix-turn-helix domain-containing protein [Halobacteriovorax marinus]CBW25677.1 phage-related conserved hypothetical protein [Halobacteriovorax marinus SJ]
MDNPNKRLLTIEEAAQLLSLKVSRLRTAVFRKEIPYIKIGRLVRFHEEHLLNWIESLTHDEEPKEQLWL